MPFLMRNVAILRIMPPELSLGQSCALANGTTLNVLFSRSNSVTNVDGRAGSVSKSVADAEGLAQRSLLYMAKRARRDDSLRFYCQNLIGPWAIRAIGVDRPDPGR